jgi:hypothetical protein
MKFRTFWFLDILVLNILVLDTLVFRHFGTPDILAFGHFAFQTFLFSDMFVFGTFWLSSILVFRTFWLSDILFFGHFAFRTFSPSAQFPPEPCQFVSSVSSLNLMHVSLFQEIDCTANEADLGNLQSGHSELENRRGRVPT